MRSLGLSPTPLVEHYFNWHRCTSCRNRGLLAQRGGDLPPAVDPAQLDLTTCDKAEEKDHGSVFARQRPLGLHAAAELLVESLDHVRGS